MVGHRAESRPALRPPGCLSPPCALASRTQATFFLSLGIFPLCISPAAQPTCKARLEDEETRGQGRARHTLQVIKGT